MMSMQKSKTTSRLTRTALARRRVIKSLSLLSKETALTTEIPKRPRWLLSR